MTIPNKSKVFISFGEIDCRHDEGFIIASSKLNKSFNQIVTKTIKDFLNFIKVNN